MTIAAKQDLLPHVGNERKVAAIVLVLLGAVISGAFINTFIGSTALFFHPVMAEVIQKASSMTIAGVVGNRFGAVFPSGGGLAGVSFDYRRQIDFTVSSSQNNVTTLLVFDSSNFDFTHAASDGGDIRFLDSDGKPLNHWIEYWDPVNEHGRIWVEVPFDGGTSYTCWMYYGASTTLPLKDNHDVMFDYFWDWEDGTIDGWYLDAAPANDQYEVTSNTNYVWQGTYALKGWEGDDAYGPRFIYDLSSTYDAMRIWFYYKNVGGWYSIAFYAFDSSGGTKSAQLTLNGRYDQFRYYDADAGSQVGINGMTDNNWYLGYMKIKPDNTYEAKWYDVDDGSFSEVASGSASRGAVSIGKLKICVWYPGTGGTLGATIDTIYVLCNLVEPSTTIGSEETGPFTPVEEPEVSNVRELDLDGNSITSLKPEVMHKFVFDVNKEPNSLTVKFWGPSFTVDSSYSTRGRFDVSWDGSAWSCTYSSLLDADSCSVVDNGDGSWTVTVVFKWNYDAEPGQWNYDISVDTDSGTATASGNTITVESYMQDTPSSESVSVSGAAGETVYSEQQTLTVKHNVPYTVKVHISQAISGVDIYIDVDDVFGNGNEVQLGVDDCVWLQNSEEYGEHQHAFYVVFCIGLGVQADTFSTDLVFSLEEQS